jgi:hypothetical protein
MLAPLPAEPVFTLERRETVNEEVPLEGLEVVFRLFLIAVFPTFVAILAAGGGGFRGSTGSGIFGSGTEHILLLWVGKQGFVLHYMLMF